MSGKPISCPKCFKALKGNSRLPKHLLTHIPRELWPYQCKFCDKFFQAKSDIPKHWKTSAHKDDPRIPHPESPAWRECLDQCEIYNVNNKDEFDLSTGYPTNVTPSQFISCDVKAVSTDQQSSMDVVSQPPLPPSGIPGPVLPELSLDVEDDFKAVSTDQQRSRDVVSKLLPPSGIPGPVLLELSLDVEDEFSGIDSPPTEKAPEPVLSTDGAMLPVVRLRRLSIPGLFEQLQDMMDDNENHTSRKLSEKLVKRQQNRDRIMAYERRKSAEQKRFACSDCDKTFILEKLLELHSKTTHKKKTDTPQKEQSFNCPVCRQAFGGKTDLQEHVRVFHTRNRSHVVKLKHCQK